MLAGADAVVTIKVLADPVSGLANKRWERIVGKLEAAASFGAQVLGAREGTVEAVIEAHAPDAAQLLVVDRSMAKAVTEDALRRGITVAWPGPEPRGALRSIALPYTGSPRSLLGPLNWLRTHCEIGEVRALALDGRHSGGIAAAEELLGLPFAVRSEPLPDDARSLSALRSHLIDTGTDLVAVAAPAGPELWASLVLLSEAGVPCPVLLSPEGRGLLHLRPELQCTDFVPVGGELRAGVVRVDAFGRVRRLDDESVSIVLDGHVTHEAVVTRGELRIPRTPATVLGIGEPGKPGSTGLRAAGGVLSLAGDPIRLVLAGSPLPPPAVGTRTWVLRMHEGPAPSALRRPGVHGVLDGSSVLDDGSPDDLPDSSGPAHLERVRRRLAWLGAPMVDGPAPPTDPSLGERLRVLAGARTTRATLENLYLDNEEARLSLLSALENAGCSIWMQTFMFEDDAVGAAVAEALLAAADRGVQVLLLVDSVFTGHGTLGRTNPALAALDAHATAQVLAARPVSEILDFRRREHRKLLIIDGARARISGRNIGAPYYTGFREVALTAESPTRTVPWLDAGADMTGEAVGEAGKAFCEAWQAAGGESLPVFHTTGGAARCHLVLHQSLSDAFTLEAYRVLLESAQRTVTLVNTFPVSFELQRVLLSLLERGVALRFLVGNVRPLHGDRVPFPGEPFRELANRVVHGRLDPLARAGADVRALVLPWREPWDPALTRVLPHVHAKLLTVDGEVSTVGSANLDIAASYWDNEALLVVEDASFTARLDLKLDALFAGSEPFDVHDTHWQALAAARKEISLYWPSWAT